MKPVYTAKQIEDLILAGQSPSTLPADAILTPSAKDFLRDLEKSGSGASSHGAAPARPNTYEAPVLPDYEFKWTPGTDPTTPGEILDFFYSPEIHVLKERICDLGRRMWERDYTDGNGGNFTIRVGDNLVLCTPTLISKGFMKPEDMCLVDLDAKQLAGKRPRTSECMTHLAIMKRQPKYKAVCHAHPTHATAFAVSMALPPPTPTTRSALVLAPPEARRPMVSGVQSRTSSLHALWQKPWRVIVPDDFACFYPIGPTRQSRRRGPLA